MFLFFSSTEYNHISPSCSTRPSVTELVFEKAIASSKFHFDSIELSRLDFPAAGIDNFGLTVRVVPMTIRYYLTVEVIVKESDCEGLFARDCEVSVLAFPQLKRLGVRCSMYNMMMKVFSLK